MASFMTRVELHGATYQDYTNLHAYMAQEGFTNTIRGSDGALYQLPPAEYELIANCSTVQAREKASKAATRTLKTFAVLTVEYSSAAWVGLSKVQQQARVY
jgi:hypothetical protein